MLAGVLALCNTWGRFSARAEVLSGLAEGDRVAVHPSGAVAEGVEFVERQCHPSPAGGVGLGGISASVYARRCGVSGMRSCTARRA